MESAALKLGVILFPNCDFRLPGLWQMSELKDNEQPLRSCPLPINVSKKKSPFTICNVRSELIPVTFVNDDIKAACQAAGAFDFPSVKRTSFRKGFLLRVKNERSWDISGQYWQPGLRCLRRHIQSILKTQWFISGRKAAAFVFLLFVRSAAAETDWTCYSEGAPNFPSKGESWESAHSLPSPTPF